MQLANLINFRIQHVANLLLRESDQVLQEQLGIGMSQFRILRLLQDDVCLSQREIAQALHQTEASISRQVKLLCQQQLTTTQCQSKDRRQHPTVLTPKGVRLTQAAFEVLQASQASLIKDFSHKRQVELLSLLEKVEHQILISK